MARPRSRAPPSRRYRGVLTSGLRSRTGSSTCRSAPVWRVGCGGGRKGDDTDRALRKYTAHPQSSNRARSRVCQLLRCREPAPAKAPRRRGPAKAGISAPARSTARGCEPQRVADGCWVGNMQTTRLNAQQHAKTVELLLDHRQHRHGAPGPSTWRSVTSILQRGVISILRLQKMTDNWPYGKSLLRSTPRKPGVGRDYSSFIKVD